MTAGLISAFNPIQDYSNVSVQPAASEDTSKFQDVLKSSTENQTKLNDNDSKKPAKDAVKETEKQPKTDNEALDRDSETVKEETDETKTEKTNTQPAEDENAKAGDITDEDIQVISQMLEQIMQTVATVLEVPVEAVEEAVENLDLDMGQIADVTKVPEIVVELTDATSTMDIMTDEKLYDSVREITAEVEKITADTAEVLDIEPQEVPKVAVEVTANAPEMAEVKTVPESEEASDEARPVTLDTDNVPLVKNETGKTDDENSETEHKDEERPNSDNQIAFTANNATEVPKETQNINTDSPAASYTTAKDIINQVSDSLKMEIKADIDELEINLHPASLGNVKIQLINKDGMITANFTTQNEVVKEAIESQLVALKENMNEQGVKVEAIEVTVESHAFDENLSKQGDRESKEAEELEGKKKKTRSIHRDDILEEGEAEPEDDIRIAREMMMANGGTVDYLT